jgi:hypothetical protein
LEGKWEVKLGKVHNWYVRKKVGIEMVKKREMVKKMVMQLKRKLERKGKGGEGRKKVGLKWKKNGKQNWKGSVKGRAKEREREAWRVSLKRRRPFTLPSSE